MSTETLLKTVKKVLLVNGVMDIATGIPLLFFPVMFSSLMQFSDINDAFRFLAGGWGIAAICLGVTRFWVGWSGEFVWPTVILGVMEGSMLGTFCVILVFATSLTLVNVVLAMLMGYGFAIAYGAAFIAHKRN